MNRYVLRWLCRHGKHLPGAWRLDPVSRAMAFRFPQDTLRCRTVWGQEMEVPANDVIGHWLYFFGHFQSGLVRAMMSLAGRPCVVIDVGANVGAFTLPFADWTGEGGHVYAIEPVKRNRALLERNVAGNRLEQRVTVVPKALGDRAGLVHLVQASEGNSGSYTVSPVAGACAEEVEMVTLDGLWNSLGRPRIDAVKVDVEGSEWAVLKGSIELFDTQHPRLWALEFSRETLAPGDREAAWRFMRDRRYRALNASLRPLESPPTESADVLFLREE